MVQFQKKNKQATTIKNLQTFAADSYKVATTRGSEDATDHLDELWGKVPVSGTEFPTVEGEGAEPTQELP